MRLRLGPNGLPICTLTQERTPVRQYIHPRTMKGLTGEHRVGLAEFRLHAGDSASDDNPPDDDMPLDSLDSADEDIERYSTCIARSPNDGESNEPKCYHSPTPVPVLTPWLRPGGAETEVSSFTRLRLIDTPTTL
jgi:hypothetical protein